MRILVLGGNGFIGCHVVDALVRAGHTIRVFGRRLPTPQEMTRGVDHVTGDFCNPQDLAKALAGIEAVYHLISTTVPATSERDPIADVQGNLVATLGLLAEMERQEIRRLIFMSSGGTVYGNPAQVPTPETHPLNPLGSYGIVKLAIEGFLARQSRNGLVPIVLRASNAYGPHQTQTGVQGFIGTVLHRMALGEPVDLLGDGSISRDFLHVRDLAQLCVLALSATTPVTVNAGSGRGTSLRDVIALAEKVSGHKVTIISHPAREIDAPVSVLDIRRARDLFDWTPAIPLEAGMAETWDWVRQTVSR